jgi:hypothetical protein
MGALVRREGLALRPRHHAALLARRADDLDAGEAAVIDLAGYREAMGR